MLILVSEGVRLSGLKLYYCRDSRALRPLWALEELGIPYEYIGMVFPPRYTFEGYKEINPSGTVPTLVDGELTMTESSAMCQYLVEKYSLNSPLNVKPSEPAYGEFLNWMYRSDATFTFPQAIYLRYHVYEKDERKQPQVAKDYIIWLFARLRVVEDALETCDYLCAGRFTVADICVGYALYLAKLLGFEDQMGSNTRAYLERICQRPAFQRCLNIQEDLPSIT